MQTYKIKALGAIMRVVQHHTSEVFGGEKRARAGLASFVLVPDVPACQARPAPENQFGFHH